MLPVKIIIADRQPMFAEGLSIILSAVEILEVVATASNSSEVLEILKKTSCHVVILDIPSPLEDDIAAIQHIRKLYPQTQVLIFTSNYDSQFISRVMLAGASGFTLKNTKKDEMISAVLKVADGEIFLGESVTQALAGDYKTFRGSLPEKQM
jgi:DNA-binding NarL/FixJ family response regulator